MDWRCASRIDDSNLDRVGPGAAFVEAAAQFSPVDESRQATLLSCEHLLSAAERLQFRNRRSAIEFEQGIPVPDKCSVLGDDARDDAAFEMLHGRDGACRDHLSGGDRSLIGSA